ncbi:hypothetical protein [Azospirillum sp. A23]|uniref:hypothetical protein n=1 Tax=Azospirillum sp. A23 TaxID=3160608 RepID=UPI0036F2FB9C
MALRLDPATIVFREFAGLEPVEPDWRKDVAYWEDYNAKFFGSNGLTYTAADSNVASWLQAPDRAPFAFMVRDLLPALERRTDLSDIDFVLLAHWLPDLHLGTSVTNYALHRLGLENGFGFAISDRGRSASLFAVHCIARYLGQGRRRALLMAMDQKHLLYRSPLVESLDPVNSACIMVLEQDGASGLTLAGYRRCPGVTAAMLASRIGLLCRDFGLDPAGTLLIADPAVAERSDFPGPVLLQRPQHLCSAPFAALAGCPDAGSDVLMIIHEQDCLTAVAFKAGCGEPA